MTELTAMEVVMLLLTFAIIFILGLLIGGDLRDRKAPKVVGSIQINREDNNSSYISLNESIGSLSQMKAITLKVNPDLEVGAIDYYPERDL